MPPAGNVLWKLAYLSHLPHALPRGRLLPVALLVLLTSCFVGPKSYSIDFPRDPNVHCATFSLPSDWTFPRYDAPAAPDRDSFENRFDPARPDSILLGGIRTSGSVILHSDEIYRIDLLPVAALHPASPAEWNAARRLEPTRLPVTPAPGGHPTVAPSLTYQGHTYKLSGTLFWLTPEVTRLSPSGRRLLAISYSEQRSAFRPLQTVHLDVFDVPSRRLVWSARGDAPELPPFGQFDTIAWLRDDLLLLPANAAATHFSLCLFRP
jgi:hypothetical protein